MKLTLSIFIQKALDAYRESSRNANTYDYPIVILDEEGNSYEILDFAIDIEGKQSLVKIKV